jgi:hypothetical protein
MRTRLAGTLAQVRSLLLFVSVSLVLTADGAPRRLADVGAQHRAAAVRPKQPTRTAFFHAEIFDRLLTALVLTSKETLTPRCVAL